MVFLIQRLKNGIVLKSCQLLFASRPVTRSIVTIGLSLGLWLLLTLAPVLAVELADADTLFPRGFKRTAPSQDPNPREADDSQPLLVTADELIASQDGNIITARGGVKIVQGSRSLTADQIVYDKIKDTVIAKSFPPNRVTFNLASGDTIYGTEIVTNSDLKNAIIQGFRLLMADNSRAAASTAIHTETEAVNSTELRRFVFSPCALCAEDPTRPPTWQLVAERGRQDSQTHDIIYRNIRLEIKGLPIFWLPYLSHPDWTVKRRSGVLPPRVGVGSTLGTVVKTPYFIVLDDQSDMTVEPDIYSNYGYGFGLEYRRVFAAGNLRFAGSMVELNPSWLLNPDVKYPKEQYNFYAGGNLAINEQWRASFNLDRVSNVSYFTQFQPDAIFRNSHYNQASNHLVSDITFERFDHRDYNQFSIYRFQPNNDVVSPPVVPFIAPYLVDSRYFGLDPTYGSLGMNSSLMNLKRLVGIDTTRFSNELVYKYQIISDIGLETIVSSSIHNDYYLISNPKPTTATSPSQANSVVPIDLIDDNRFNQRIYRGFPIAGIKFNYPLAAAGSSLSMTPSVQFVASPRGLNPDAIPNNDSQSFDLNEVNLFELNRFAGNDRVSSGSRVDYAYRLEAGFKNGIGLGGFVGQSYRFDDDFLYPVGSGPDRQLSDLLSKISFNYLSNIRLSYSLRLDNKYFEPSRQELSATLASKPMVFSASYIENNPRIHSEAESLASEKDGFMTPLSRSLNLSTRFFIYDDWQGFGHWNRDLVHPNIATYGGGIRFRDDCFGYQISAERNTYSYGLVRPSTTIMFTVGFKYLGDWDYASSGF
ncbi:MAG: LPS assembly protein LptD [Candidatus Pacebacteria bacterium]|nr:LPS assembly protein LptD [Candidatus Paceibacterota bacterium]